MGPTSDRRKSRRGTASLARRRYPRVQLDVDWFLEVGEGYAATFGRGLDISPRGARLPVAVIGNLAGPGRAAAPATSENHVVSPFGHLIVSPPASLYVALPGRARMFHAKGTVRASSKGAKGLVVLFHEVSDADLFHLGLALIDSAGITAIPLLERRFARLADLPSRVLRDSTSV